MRYLNYLLLAIVLGVMQGCFPIVAAGVGAGALISSDRRTAGIILEDEEPQPRAKRSGGRTSRRKTGGLSSYPIEGLQKMLEDVLNSEDYERAALIRDEIKRREEEEAK